MTIYLLKFSSYWKVSEPKRKLIWLTRVWVSDSYSWHADIPWQKIEWTKLQIDRLWSVALRMEAWKSDCLDLNHRSRTNLLYAKPWTNHLNSLTLNFLFYWNNCFDNILYIVKSILGMKLLSYRRIDYIF